MFLYAFGVNNSKDQNKEIVMKAPDRIAIRLSSIERDMVTELKQSGFNISGLVRQMIRDKYHSVYNLSAGTE